jgi:putative ATPase
MKELGYGEEYKYSHDFTNNFCWPRISTWCSQNTAFYVPEIIQRKYY